MCRRRYDGGGKRCRTDHHRDDSCVESYEEERYRRDDSDNSAYRGYFRVVFLCQGELVLCGNSLREVSRARGRNIADGMKLLAAGDDPLRRGRRHLDLAEIALAAESCIKSRKFAVTHTLLGKKHKSLRLAQLVGRALDLICRGNRLAESRAKLVEARLVGIQP